MHKQSQQLFFGLANKEIELIGFEGLETYLIAKN